MAFLYRFLRFTRDKALFPVFSIVAFSFLLTWIFILYQPTPGPGELQQMGWQSWDVVNMKWNLSASGGATGNSATPGSSDSNDHYDDDGNEKAWWQIEAENKNKVDYLSLPLDKWNPLLPHNTGFSEITVAKCFVPPGLGLDLCKPDSTPEQDAIKGKWVRVNADLNLQAGRFSPYLYIYYRRTRRQDVNLVDKILLLGGKEVPPSEPPEVGTWEKAGVSLRTGVSGEPDLYLWYRLGKTTTKMSDKERNNVITEIDVLYGEDVPFYGFEKLEPPSTPYLEKRREAVHLTYRRGVKQSPRAPPPHFSSQGTYKILQVADLHYSVSQGNCRDTAIPDCHNSDNLTSSLISRILDLEEPDLVVFTGDQLNGQGTSWHPRSVLSKFAKALTERSRPVPWAAVFGNHDSETGAVTRGEQIEIMKALPYSVDELNRGPDDVHGEGNYVVKVRSGDPSRIHLLTLYFLDSGDYIRNRLDWFGILKPTDYDHIRESQINWFLQQSASIKPVSRPFQPDTAKDLGHVWRRRDLHPLSQRDKRQQHPAEETRLAKPNALMFFHIPLPEAYSPADKNPGTGKSLDVGTYGLEGAGNAKGNDGFFDQGVLKAMESQHVDGGGKLEVKVIGNGHCHLTDNCRRVKGVWMCFGGGGSYSAYGKSDFARRFRVYDIQDFGETIRTYKRTDHGELIDDMVVVGNGAVGM